MSRVSQHQRGGIVFDELAGRLRQMVRDVHARELSGVERFRVVRVNPFTVQQVQGELSLEDGDPDFTVGGTLRGLLASGQVLASDLVWAVRNDGEWHAFDVVSSGAVGGGGGGGGTVTPMWFTQSSAATTWTLHHGLGRYPAVVTLYDPAGDEMPLPAIANPDTNTTVVTFSTPKSGSAVIL